VNERAALRFNPDLPKNRKRGRHQQLRPYGNDGAYASIKELLARTCVLGPNILAFENADLKWIPTVIANTFTPAEHGRYAKAPLDPGRPQDQIRMEIAPAGQNLEQRLPNTKKTALGSLWM